MLCTRGKNIKSQEEKGSLREVASLKLIVCALRPACERKTKEEKKEERKQHCTAQQHNKTKHIQHPN
jgi:hypothetical protein